MPTGTRSAIQIPAPKAPPTVDELRRTLAAAATQIRPISMPAALQPPQRTGVPKASVAIPSNGERIADEDGEYFVVSQELFTMSRTPHAPLPVKGNGGAAFSDWFFKQFF